VPTAANRQMHPAKGEEADRVAKIVAAHALPSPRDFPGATALDG